MDKLLSANTIKNVFYALGAKTSDSNYAVALLNKTSGAPAGFMDMSNLASVLGGIPNVADSTITDFNSVNYSCITTINGTNVQNSPKNGWGCFVCIKSGAYCPQMFFVGSDRSMYYRTSNNGDWIRSYDNTILSDSTILSPLASALGAPKMIEADGIASNGTYTLDTQLYTMFSIYEANSGANGVILKSYNSVEYVHKSSNFDANISIPETTSTNVTIKNLRTSTAKFRIVVYRSL